MDKREATEILRLYRPGVNDDQDPRMAEALQLAQRDPELAAWFKEHCRLFTKMRSALNDIPIPPDLKGKILREDARRRGRIVQLRNPMIPLAAAAALALLAVGLWSLFVPAKSYSFADCRERVVKQSQRGYVMNMTSTSLDAIHTYLVDNKCPDYALPKKLASLTGEGCATLEWRDRKVSMVCLNTGRKELFLFVMDRVALQHAPESAVPEFAPIRQLMTASWAQGDKIYILAGPGNEADLKRYLD